MTKTYTGTNKDWKCRGEAKQSSKTRGPVAGASGKVRVYKGVSYE